MPNCLILFEFKSNSIFCFGNQFKYNSVHLISETNGCFNVQKHNFMIQNFRCHSIKQNLKSLQKLEEENDGIMYVL